MTDWKADYDKSVSAENLARQAPAVQKTAEEILKELRSVEQCLYWAIDPEDDAAQWAANLIEHAHALLDLSHDYRAALKNKLLSA